MPPMDNNPSNSNQYLLLRGGKKIKLNKAEDYIAVKTKTGAEPETLTRALDCEVYDHIYQQNLTVMSVAPGKTDQVLADMKGRSEVSFASNVFQMSEDPLGQIFMTEEITVQFKPGTKTTAIDEIIAEFGLNYKKQVEDLANTYVFKIAEGNDEDPIALTNELMEQEEIDWCEPNIVVKSQHFFTPSDNLFGEQWHLFHEGGIQLASGSHVDATRAWDFTRGDRSIVIAVADDSVDLAHSDFQGLGKIVAPRDFQGRDFNPSPEGRDENHGTSVAGVAVAEANGSGVVGAAPDCSLMPLRTSGFLDDNSIEVLFDYVRDNGAAIMVNSWGPAAINFPLSIRQNNAITRCARQGRGGKGVMIFFAAGNVNRPINGIVNETGWPNGELNGPTQWLDGFATHPDVIAVSACTSIGTKSFYSSWGNEISVCAPSNNGHPGTVEGPTFPFVRGSFPGRGIVTTDRVGPSGYDASDFTFDFGGTSSACPLAAGVAGLILSANPELTAAEGREILESTTDKIVDPSTDPQLGFANGDYDENGHSLWFGFGKVNAFKAVTKALAMGNGGGNSGEVDPSEIAVSSSPNLAIPDNNRNGIQDTITVSEQGRLQKVIVNVKITHSYIGDLVVVLISPSGKSIPLHNRNGGSADNLQGQYDLLSVPGLGDLAGDFIQGEWTIQVQDLARLDTGVLDSWGLEFTAAPAEVLVVGEEPGEVIPDADPSGLTRQLNVAQSGKVKAIKVAVDITHTYASDLVISLTAPTGTTTVLHNREGGSSDNIQRVYSKDNNRDFLQLTGLEAAGDWSLTVQDLAVRDVGKLNAWSIELDLENSTEV